MRTFNFLIDFSGRATNQTQRIYGREKIMMAEADWSVITWMMKT